MKRQLLLALVLPCFANAGGIGGPVIGYVPEPAAQALRPILGVPGASLMGARVPLGLEAVASVISPQNDYILALAADGAVNVIELSGHDVHVVTGCQAATTSRIALSPSGSRAALLSGAVLQAIEGLPAQPSVARTLEAPNPGAFAISDDGALLFESGGTLFAAAPGGDPRPIPFAGQASLIVFLEGTRDALVAGREDNQLALVRDVTGTPAYGRLAGAAQGIDVPLALAFANGRALAANRNSVVAIDLETGAATTAPCECSVTGLERMRAPALFRVNGLGAGPLWLFDATENRFLFVPAPAEEVQQ